MVIDLVGRKQLVVDLVVREMFDRIFPGVCLPDLGILGRVLRGLCGSLFSAAKYGYGSNCQIGLVMNPWKRIQDGIRFILFYSRHGSLSVHPWHGHTSAVTSNSLNVVSG
jgi:hypothetical protein